MEEEYYDYQIAFLDFKYWLSVANSIAGKIHHCLTSLDLQDAYDKAISHFYDTKLEDFRELYIKDASYEWVNNYMLKYYANSDAEMRDAAGRVIALIFDMALMTSFDLNRIDRKQLVNGLEIKIEGFSPEDILNKNINLELVLDLLFLEA